MQPTGRIFSSAFHARFWGRTTVQARRRKDAVYKEIDFRQKQVVSFGQGSHLGEPRCRKTDHEIDEDASCGRVIHLEDQVLLAQFRKYCRDGAFNPLFNGIPDHGQQLGKELLRSNDEGQPGSVADTENARIYEMCRPQKTDTKRLAFIDSQNNILAGVTHCENDLSQESVLAAEMPRQCFRARTCPKCDLANGRILIASQQKDIRSGFENPDPASFLLGAGDAATWNSRCPRRLVLERPAIWSAARHYRHWLSIGAPRTALSKRKAPPAAVRNERCSIFYAAEPSQADTAILHFIRCIHIFIH